MSTSTTPNAVVQLSAPPAAAVSAPSQPLPIAVLGGSGALALGASVEDPISACIELEVRGGAFPGACCYPVLHFDRVLDHLHHFTSVELERVVVTIPRIPGADYTAIAVVVADSFGTNSKGTYHAGLGMGLRAHPGRRVQNFLSGNTTDAQVSFELAIPRGVARSLKAILPPLLPPAIGIWLRPTSESTPTDGVYLVDVDLYVTSTGHGYAGDRIALRA
jgi:hypothetical protein